MRSMKAGESCGKKKIPVIWDQSTGYNVHFKQILYNIGYANYIASWYILFSLQIQFPLSLTLLYLLPLHSQPRKRWQQFEHPSDLASSHTLSYAQLHVARLEHIKDFP